MTLALLSVPYLKASLPPALCVCITHTLRHILHTHTHTLHMDTHICTFCGWFQLSTWLIEDDLGEQPPGTPVRGYISRGQAEGNQCWKQEPKRSNSADLEGIRIKILETKVAWGQKFSSLALPISKRRIPWWTRAGQLRSDESILRKRCLITNSFINAHIDKLWRVSFYSSQCLNQGFILVW